MICAGPGTCRPDCELWSVCHCGCGQPTNRAPQWRRSHGYVAGRYHRFIHNHHRTLLPPLPTGWGPKKGVPYAEVEWRVQLLIDRYGLAGAARRAHLSQRGLGFLRDGVTSHVQRRTARKLQEATWRWLPTAPLRVLLEGRMPAWPTITRHVYRTAYVPFDTADRYATTLGVHPWTIWGDDWLVPESTWEGAVA